MKLTVLERISLPDLFPEKGNLHQMKMCKDILSKIEFTADEIKKGNIEIVGTKYSFPQDNNFETDIKFTKDEFGMLQENANRLNSRGEVTQQTFTIIEKLID